MIKEITCAELWSEPHTLAWEYLQTFTYPWEAVSGIQKFIVELSSTLGNDYEEAAPQVFVHRTATVAPTAFLAGPCIIGEGAEVRHCAFIRGSALVGAGSVVGNSTELKNVILFDGVQVPHYNYVGDSILGYKSHMGAGSITSNMKSDKTNVTVQCGGQRLETGLRKFGAAVGDFVEVGCGSVLNPGTVIGAKASVYPLSMVRGAVPAGSIYKKQGEIVARR